jgi:uncharacterized protein with GYD domain
MSTFVTLFKFIPPNKGGGPDRFKRFTGLIEAEGGKLLSFYGLMGEYDVMIVCEYPAIRNAMKAAAAIGNLINAQPRTMAALERDECLKLLSEL